MRRFEARWQRWDEDVRNGVSPPELLARLSDETMLELLASGGGAERRYERNVLATEILNRLRRLRRDLAEATAEAVGAIGETVDSAHDAARAAQRSERSIVRHFDVRGDEEVADERGAARAATGATAVVEARAERLLESQRGLRDLAARAHRLARPVDEADEPA